MRNIQLILVAAGLLAGGRAFALTQSTHEEIAITSCTNHGLPANFCKQLGSEAYNVDHYEFDDLSAHGQMEEGEDACDAADAVLRRIHDLGREIHGELWNSILSPNRQSNDALAHALGRLLHTAQDDCAHSGMGNPQHAWKSLSDVCDGTSVSPDVQPDAILCARFATDDILDAVVDTLHDNGAEVDVLGVVDSTADHWPSYGDACGFLGSAHEWDGVDRRWDNDIVEPALRAAARASISSFDDPGAPAPICASAPDGILVGYDDDQDVSGGPPDCVQITVFCVGKADSPDEAAPPYELVSPPVPHAGCSIGENHGSGGWAVLFVTAVALCRRRARVR
jgi:hypothetical protein